MTSQVPVPPNMFDSRPFAGKWFHWNDIDECFWPGVGGRSEKVDPPLASVRCQGGIYLLAWSPGPPKTITPSEQVVKCIGETSGFKARLGKFCVSAGFRGPRKKGHSNGRYWPEGAKKDLWVSFFPIGNELLPHLARGLRCWMEAVALEEHRLANGQLPQVNMAKKEATF